MTLPARSRRVIWRTVAGYALAIASILVLAFFFELDYETGVEAIATLNTFQVFSCFLLVVLHLWLASLAFCLSLERFSPSIHPRRCRSLWFATLLAKYLPGGIWNPVTRGGLLMAEGVPLSAVTWVSLLEQGSTLISTVLLAILIWSFSQAPSGPSAVWLSLAFVLAFSFWSVALFWLGFKRHAMKISACYAASMASFALAYIALFTPADPLAFSAALFGSTAAGIAAIPAPSGLGVRESALSISMNSDDISGAMAMALAVRLIIFIAEISLSFLHIRFYSVGTERT